MKISREELAKSMLLYAVTDSSWLGGRSLADVAGESLEGGVTFLQIREKTLGRADFAKLARTVIPKARAMGVPVVINDDVAVAVECGADGAHIGQYDMPVGEARRDLGPGKILGVSVETVEQARRAEADGADYLGVGAMFNTSTKLDAESVSLSTLREICASVSIPVVAIGGISLKTLPLLANTGIDGIAVVSAIYAQPDVKTAAGELLEACKSAHFGMDFQKALFDMDGTLLDSMPVWERAADIYLEGLGIRGRPGLSAKVLPMTIIESANYLRDEYGIDKSTQEIIDGLNEIPYRGYSRDIPFKPGAKEFLRKLNDAGIECCIVTATDRKLVESALTRLGALQYFKFILTCTEFGSGKNTPAIFRGAMAKLGGDVNTTVVFEDAPHAIESAKKGGMRVVAVADDSAAGKRDEIRKMADIFFEDFRSFPDKWIAPRELRAKGIAE